MADLDEYLYRAEQIAIWEQRVDVKMIAEELGVSEYLATKILLSLENHGSIKESEEEGVFTVWQSRAVNANEANREMHILLNVAVRYVRDCKVLQKEDLEKLPTILGVTKTKARQVLKMLEALGVIEKTPMYRALTEEDSEAQGVRWYNIHESSVQLIDPQGEQQIIHRTDDYDAIYPQVEAYVIEQQEASTAMLQRRFQIGYARAASLMDMLEEQFVVTPRDGSKPRKVLKKKPHSDDGAK